MHATIFGNPKDLGLLNHPAIITEWDTQRRSNHMSFSLIESFGLIIMHPEIAPTRLRDDIAVGLEIEMLMTFVHDHEDRLGET